MGATTLTKSRVAEAIAAARKASDPVDSWLSDAAPRGVPTLVLRVKTTGRGRAVLARYYARYLNGTAKREHRVLGDHTESFGLEQARAAIGPLLDLYRGGVRDLNEHFAQAAEDAARAAQEARRREIELTQRGNLRALLRGYLASLGASADDLALLDAPVVPGQRPPRGSSPSQSARQSMRDVRTIFRRHVVEPWPALLECRAAEVRPTDLRPVLARVVEQGHGRTAVKLRSYLRAAFAAAIEAEYKPDAPSALLGFGLDLNPVDVLDKMRRFNLAGDRALNDAELASYQRRVCQLSNPAVKAALRMALLLGGQRPAQLLRATITDIDLEAGTIMLRDGKGARSRPRLHLLPLTETTTEMLRGLIASATAGLYVFSTDNGRRMLRTETLSNNVSRIAAEMSEAGEARADFDLRDLRRTVETTLARLGVARDIRAQLQSHGLGGIQSQHYDRHDYINEKRRALRIWERHLTRIESSPTESNVVSIGARATSN